MRSRLIAGFVSFFVLAALVLIATKSGDVAYATTWRPTSPTTTLSTTATSANPDSTTTFNIPSPDSNFSAPGPFTFGDSSFAVADDAAIPNGAIIASLTSTATLGLANGTCATTTPVSFQFLESDTSVTDTIVPSGPPANKLQNLTQDNRGANPGDPPNGLPDFVDANPSYNNTLTTPAGGGTPVQARARYAGYVDVAALLVLLQFLIFDEGALLVLPNGETLTADLGKPSFTVLQDPTAAASNSAISDFCTPLASATTLRGVTADNGCTPTPCSQPPPFVAPVGGSNTCSGTGEGGCVRTTSPAAARTTQTVTQALSLRDTDDDGHENNLDPCTTTPNASWDPRGAQPSANDVDGDGLPTACDPDESALTGFNSDQDGDLWPNRLDICPTVFNGDATLTADTDGTPSYEIGDTVFQVNNTGGFYVGDRVRLDPGDTANVEERVISAIDPPPGATNITVSVAAGKPHAVGDTISNLYVAADGVTPRPNEGQGDQDVLFPASVPGRGPRSDATGPECDAEPSTPNGHFHETATVSRNCIGGTDADVDGVCDGTAGVKDPNPGSSDSDGDGIPDRADNCMNQANPPPAGFTQPDDNLDGIGNGCNDYDNDGGLDSMENHAGTDKRSHCAATNTADDEGLPDARLTDFNDDTAVTGAELSAIAGVIGTTVPPTDVRRDIAPDPAGDNATTGADLSRIAGAIGTTCA